MISLFNESKTYLGRQHAIIERGSIVCSTCNSRKCVRIARAQWLQPHLCWLLLLHTHAIKLLFCARVFTFLLAGHDRIKLIKASSHVEAAPYAHRIIIELLVAQVVIFTHLIVFRTSLV